MKQQLNEIKRLQKIAGILTESEINASIIEKLMADYPRIEKKYSNEYNELVNDFSGTYLYPLDNFDVSIHHFGGEIIDGAKSILVGKSKNPKQKSPYWKIEADDNMQYPFGEFTTAVGRADGYF